MQVSQVAYLSDHDPEAVASYNPEDMTAKLYGGAVVPIVNVRTEEGDDACLSDLYLFEKLMVVVGPTPGGLFVMVEVYDGDRPITHH